MTLLMEIFSEVEADKVRFFRDFLNDVLNGREKLDKETVYRFIRSFYPGTVPQSFINFTFNFAIDILKKVKKSKVALNKNTVVIDKTKDIATIYDENEFESNGYNGKFVWNNIVSFYYDKYQQSLTSEKINNETTND